MRAQDRMGPDFKASAKLCGECGGWPASVRPNHKEALCEDCQKHKE